MFENLSEKLDRALQVIKGDHKISEIKIAETAKEIRRVLVDAHVYILRSTLSRYS